MRPVNPQIQEYSAEERATRAASRAPIPEIRFPIESRNVGGRIIPMTERTKETMGKIAAKRAQSGRVGVIGQSEGLKEAVAATGVQPPDYSVGVKGLRKEMKAPGASRPPRKAMANAKEGTSSSVVHPKLDRPTPTTPSRRENYREDQLAKAAELNIPRSRVNILPPSHEDYPMSATQEATRVTSPQMIKQQGAAFKPHEVRADFEEKKTNLYSALTSAREKHRGEGGGNPETEAAVTSAQRAYDSHMRSARARHTQRGTAPVVSSETDESGMREVPVSYAGKPVKGGKPVESLARSTSDKTRNWLEGQGRQKNRPFRAVSRPKSEPDVPAN